MFLLYRIVSILLTQPREDMVLLKEKRMFNKDNLLAVMGVEHKKRGSINLPPTDIQRARQAIIDRNKAAGKNTPISELREPDYDEEDNINI